MRHPSSLAAGRRRAARRAAIVLHRRPPPVWRRAAGRDAMRTSDLVLALLGVVLLGGLALVASVDLVGRSLAQ